MAALPSEIALTKIVKARMKMMRDALPSIMINFLTTCCPIKAATVATATKYRAAKVYRNKYIRICSQLLGNEVIISSSQ